MVKLSSKLKAALLLTSTIVIINIMVIFLFRQIDTLINGELYNYGLQFDTHWAIEYWSYSHLLPQLLIFGAISAGFSAISLLLKRKNSTTRVLPYLFLTSTAVANSLAIYYFTRIDFIVSTTLYDYGLQFSLNWATLYWNYIQLSLITVGLTILFALVSAILVSVNERKAGHLNTQKIAASVLLLTGATAFITSIIYASQIVAFIGLGLIFWGITFAYIRSEEYVQKDLMEAAVLSENPPLTQTFTNLGFKGSAIYLPPKYLQDISESKVYISKDEQITLPATEHAQNRVSNPLTKIPSGLFLTPPGAELAKLFETNLGTNFTRVDMQFLQQNMPRLLTETLEIMQSFEIEQDDREIWVTARNLHVKALAVENESFSLGSILSSAIACVLAKSLGEPIILKNQSINEKDKSVKIEYGILKNLRRNEK
jgi:hypothetical protein